MSVLYNPDLWAESMWRALKSYVTGLVDPKIYEVVFGYPSARDLDRLLPLDRTLIHFEIDDIPVERGLGLGDNYVEAILDETTPAPPGKTVEYWEAREHHVDFDVGVWASAESGGVTSRLKARTLLTRCFSGTTAYRNCLATTDGIHIKAFSGGRNLVDSFGDIPLWRTVDISLMVQVFSRFKVPPVGYIDSATQAPAIEIGGVTISG